MLGRAKYIGIIRLLLVTGLLLACKSKEEKPVDAPLNLVELPKKLRNQPKPPEWINVVSAEGETLQFAHAADFYAGCPRAGDPDIDGVFREGCPLRAEKWNDLIEYVDTVIKEHGDSVWCGSFKNNIQKRVSCKHFEWPSIGAYLVNSVVIFRFVDYFDSIDVQYRGGVAYLGFNGYVDYMKRGYKKNGDIADGGMGDVSETILILKHKNLKKITMTSPSRVVRGDYLVKDRALIPVPATLLWPCPL